MSRDPCGGYMSGAKPVSDLAPPPKGPGIGSRLAVPCACGHPWGDHTSGGGQCLHLPDVCACIGFTEVCHCPCHLVAQPGVVPCPRCDG